MKFLIDSRRKRSDERALKILSRTLHNYIIKRRNQYYSLYLHQGKWTIRQADLIFALILRWRVRRIIRDIKVAPHLKELNDHDSELKLIYSTSNEIKHIKTSKIGAIILL